MKTRKQVSVLGLASLMAVITLSGCTTQPSKASDAKGIEPNTRVVEYQKVSPQKLPEPVQQVKHEPAPVKAEPEPAKVNAKVEQHSERKKPHYIKITGVGYGSESTYEGYTLGQRRLMAIRASKLDAYRSLAEQLYGIKIDSNTAVSTLTAQTDSFRARVNAVVRGARIVSITPLADHNYETVLEVYVDRDFFNNAFVYTGKNANAEAEGSVMSIGDICANGGCR
ncbi:LPP20 family lipoprotein [Galenea microaerophila]